LSNPEELGLGGPACLVDRLHYSSSLSENVEIGCPSQSFLKFLFSGSLENQVCVRVDKAWKDYLVSSD
jgi:hypothetical protein